MVIWTFEGEIHLADQVVRTSALLTPLAASILWSDGESKAMESVMAEKAAAGWYVVLRVSELH